MRRQAKQDLAAEAVRAAARKKQEEEWDAYVNELVQSADGVLRSQRVLDLSG
jgi:hypothetical protein